MLPTTILHRRLKFTTIYHEIGFLEIEETMIWPLDTLRDEVLASRISDPVYYFFLNEQVFDLFCGVFGILLAPWPYTPSSILRQAKEKRDDLKGVRGGCSWAFGIRDAAKARNEGLDLTNFYAWSDLRLRKLLRDTVYGCCFDYWGADRPPVLVPPFEHSEGNLEELKWLFSTGFVDGIDDCECVQRIVAVAESLGACGFAVWESTYVLLMNDSYSFSAKTLISLDAPFGLRLTEGVENGFSYRMLTPP